MSGGNSKPPPLPVEDIRYPEVEKDVSAWKKYGYGHDKVHGDRALERTEMYAEHKSHTLADFLEALGENYEDLKVVAPSLKPVLLFMPGKLESSKKKTSTNKEIKVPQIPQIMYNAYLAPFICTECTSEFRTSSQLLNHLFTHSDDDEAEDNYQVLGVVPEDINALYEEALRTQRDKSYIEKEIQNSEQVLRCPIGSPLGSFLSMPALKVYVSAYPKLSKPKEDRFTVIIIKRDGIETTLSFDYSAIEETANKVHEQEKLITEDKNLNYLEDLTKWNQCRVVGAHNPGKGTTEERIIRCLELQEGTSIEAMIAACEEKLEFFHRPGRTIYQDPWAKWPLRKPKIKRGTTVQWKEGPAPCQLEIELTRGTLVRTGRVEPTQDGDRMEVGEPDIDLADIGEPAQAPIEIDEMKGGTRTPNQNLVEGEQEMDQPQTPRTYARGSKNNQSRLIKESRNLFTDMANNCPQPSQSRRSHAQINYKV